jgi:hypothetical protein
LLKKKGGEYCKEVKKSFISLDPPPEPSSVVVVKRKYSSLARDLKNERLFYFFTVFTTFFTCILFRYKGNKVVWCPIIGTTGGCI